jgi:HEAT repeat protein
LELSFMPDRRKRLMILAGVAALLAMVVAFQHLLPGGDESQEKATLAAPAGARDDGQAPPAAGSPVAATPEVPYARLFAISQQPGPQDVPVLKKAIQSPSWQDRHAAVTGLGRLKDKGDPPALLAVLSNAQEKPEVRAAAAEQLGAMMYVDAGPALLDAMSDESELVRTAAGVALSKLMGMVFDFSARDPADKREQAIARARNCWQRFYEEFQQTHNRGG